MSWWLLHGRLFVRGVVLSAASAALVAGCEPSIKRLPSLPPVFKAPSSAEPGRDFGKGLQYRSEGGEAIRPVALADDPVSPLAQPSAGDGKSGRSTLNGDPNGLSRETLNRSIQGAMGSLAACFTNITQDPMVAVSFEADPSGRPSLVRVNGAPPDAERCIRNVVQGIRFPSFEGKGVQVDLPLSFHRVAAPQPPSNPQGQQAQGAAPPLFLEP